MPYLYIHALHGLRAQTLFDNEIREMTTVHRDAFLLGMYGPDMYFYDRLPPPLFRKHRKRLSDKLHGCDAERVFSALFPLCCRDDRAFSYALGMLCHFTLDYTVHGYVESRYRGNDHTRFEMRMELPFCDRVNDPAARETPWALFSTDRARRMADSLQTALFSELFQVNTEGVYRRSYRNWRRMLKLVYDPLGKKCRLLRHLEHPPGAVTGFLITRDPTDCRDLFNDAHLPWAAPWEPGTVRTESFFELFEAAVEEAARIANAAARERKYCIFDEAVRLIGHRCMNGTVLSE